jgi:serine phosphatase RsbU (regulator of sigma subunit)
VNIQIATFGQAVAIAVALYALYGFARRPSRETAEVAAFLAAFALGASFINPDLPIGLFLIGILALAAQTYLIVRLSDHVSPVPRWFHALMLGAAVYVGAWNIWFGFDLRFEGTAGTQPTPPIPIALSFLVIYLVAGAYSAGVFVRASFVASGARLWRARLAALGLVALVSAAVIWISASLLYQGERGEPQPPQVALDASSAGVALASLLFFAAFAPPPWLRQLWRLGELQRFLRDTASVSIGERGREALEALVGAAIRATGAVAASVVRPNDSGSLAEPGSAVARAWADQRPTAMGTELAVPIRTKERAFGILRVTFRQPPLFAEDDAAILALMADHTAIALSNDELFRTQRVLEERERKRAEAELARFEDELRVAREIQQALLPRELPDLPGWRIASYYEPARQVGGDFFDAFPLADGRSALVIGDASGKGIPAALLMATTRSVLRAAGANSSAPGAILATANEILCRAMPANMFVTCMILAVEPATGRIRYANAGHDMGYLRCDGAVTEIRARGMPLGLMPESIYEECEGTLPVRSTLLIYSDGIVEAHDQRSDMFGFGRLRSVVGRADGDLIAAVLTELRTFTPPGWEQEDDITILTAERLG